MPRLLLIPIIIATVLFSCSRNGSGGAGRANIFTSLADFSGKKIGSEAAGELGGELGGVFPQLIDRIIPNVEHKYYLTFDDIVAALSTDAVDAIALDMPIALYLAAHNKEFAVFPYVISVYTYGFAVTKGSRLREEANAILRKLKESGVIDDAEMYWFSADDGKEKTMPQLNHRPDFDGSAGTIKFGCDNTLFPMSYTTPDGKPMGLDIDILNRIAYEMNMTVEIVPMSFGKLLPALLAGQVDMVGGSLTITEERKESVDFIGPYFEGGVALVVKKKRLPER